MLQGNTRIVQKLWSDRATITVANSSRKDGRGFTVNADVEIVNNEPCKVVKKSLNSGKQGFYDEIKYNALLLIKNGIDIPAGADIEVTDIHGNKTAYRLASGGFANYTTHQEVAMVVDKKA